MLPTAFAETLAERVLAVLGPALTSVILHGSLATGDYVPGASDIDLLAVTEDRLTEAQCRGLIEAASTLGHQYAIPFDLRVVTRSAAENPVPEPPMELYVGFHPASRPEPEVAGPTQERDLVVEFWVCRDQGRAIVGLQPSEVIGVVPNAWVTSVGKAYLERWQRVPYDERVGELMVLIACRVWRFHVEGVHSTKTVAGQWVLRQDPSLTAVTVALERRNSGSGQRFDEAEVQAVLSRALEVVQGDG